MSDVPSNLFENSNCPIPEVPRVDFTFIADEDCAITPLPPPIYECEPPIVLPEPDTEVGVRCPIFPDINSTITVGYASGGDCPISSTPRAELRIIRTDIDPCAYTVGLDINVPIPRPPCEPQFRDGEFFLEVGYDDCVSPRGNIIITKSIIEGDCDTPDVCDFLLDLDLAIPIPRPPCPVMRRGDFTVTTGFTGAACLAEKRSLFRITPQIIPGDCDNPTRCEFTFDLDIVVTFPKPPCPILRRRTFRVSSAFSNRQNCQNLSRFTITPTTIPGDNCRTPDTCIFDFDLEIFVPLPPIPCPTIRERTFEVAFGYAGAACMVGKRNYFKITPTTIPGGDCRTPDRCEFDIDLEIAIPFPKPPCPVLNRRTFSIATGFAGAACLLNKESKFEITPRIILGDGCKTPDRCEFDIDLEIVVPIPKPPCPVLNRRTFSIAAGFAGSACLKEPRFEITPRVIPGNGCDTPDRCEFDIDLEIVVPIPKPPCPTISERTFDVAYGYARSACMTNKRNYFKVTPKTILGNGCDTPDRCEFDIDLEIAIPFPKPPCPTIRERTFDVAFGYANSPCMEIGRASCRERV